MICTKTFQSATQNVNEQIRKTKGSTGNAKILQHKGKINHIIHEVSET